MSEVEDLSPKAPQIDALKAEITFDEFTKNGKKDHCGGYR